MLPKHPVKRIFFRTTTSLLAAFSSILLGIYQATLNIETEGLEHLLLLKAHKKNFIIAVWHTFVDAAIFTLHSHELLIYSDHPRTAEYENSWTHYFRQVGLKTIESLGFETLDASLGKQSVGIVNFIKKIRGGRPALVAPDGPHGPNYSAKPGTIYIAQKSGSTVLPIGFGFSRFIMGSNWDDFALPVPFSRVSMVIGSPMEIPPKLSNEEREIFVRQLENRLDELSFRAADIIAAAPLKGQAL